MTHDSWHNFVTELKQCVAGSRGWVSCSKKRAAGLGIAHSNLTVAAAALGLVVAQHGTLGYVASKPHRF